MVAAMTMVMAVMACNVQFADQAPAPSSPSLTVTVQPTMRIGIISLTPSKTVIITASEAVRLRDRPDAAGPVDSIELTVMHPGDTMQVESCQFMGGNWWAFGTYVSRATFKGWANAEFLSPNPCTGGS